MLGHHCLLGWLLVRAESEIGEEFIGVTLHALNTLSNRRKMIGVVVDLLDEILKLLALVEVSRDFQLILLFMLVVSRFTWLLKSLSPPS